jgi:hypothetical protein
MAERPQRKPEHPESEARRDGADPPDDDVEVGVEGGERDTGEDAGEEEEERAECLPLRDDHAATLAAAGLRRRREYNPFSNL